MKLLVVGDSLVEGLSFDFPHHIECKPGETTDFLFSSFGLNYLLKEDEYDAVILMFGTNDADPMRSIQNLKRIQNDCHIFICTIMNDVFNEELRAWLPTSKRYPISFLHEDIDIDFLQDDGIHLSDAGKRAFSAAILVKHESFRFH